VSKINFIFNSSTKSVAMFSPESERMIGKINSHQHAKS